MKFFHYKITRHRLLYIFKLFPVVTDRQKIRFDDQFRVTPRRKITLTPQPRKNSPIPTGRTAIKMVTSRLDVFFDKNLLVYFHFVFPQFVRNSSHGNSQRTGLNCAGLVADYYFRLGHYFYASLYFYWKVSEVSTSLEMFTKVTFSITLYIIGKASKKCSETITRLFHRFLKNSSH